MVVRHRFATRQEAWLAIHSALGFKSPVEYETKLN
jgi:hypothetical protein